MVPRLVAGTPLSPAAREALFEGRAPLLECLYLGIGVLVLGGLALAGGGRGGRLSLAGAAFFLLAALGRHTAVYRVLSLVPGFTLMRYPQKHLLPFALCAALAAGFGAVAWASEWSVAARRRGRWIAWAVIGLGAGLLATAARMRVGVPLLATVLEDPAQIVPVSVSASLGPADRRPRRRPRRAAALALRA